MIKVLVPSMPTADEILPWLRQMDEAKVYVNHGPMVQLLERELAMLVCKAPCAVVSNGTLALELALRALNLPAGADVLVPAVTYVATGQAIVNAGLTPVICDVNPVSWTLRADTAFEIAKNHRVLHAVVPVAAFGVPLPIADWERFIDATGLPVVMDAAGAIMDQAPPVSNRISICYSLHATKALGAGEGGVVASRDETVVASVRDLANFGAGGTNAKMSEYHASAALASMRRTSSWRETVNRAYAHGLPPGIGLQGGMLQPNRTLLPVLLPKSAPMASLVCAKLQEAGIESKLWYRPFLDERTQFHGFAKWGQLTTTEMLRQRLLGLPYHQFLTEADVADVCQCLTRIIE